MLGSMQKIKNAVIYPMMVCVGLSLSSCSTSRQYYKNSPAESKITFAYKDPKTLDEIASACADVNLALGYISRFDDIKRGLIQNPEYNPRNDLVDLVDDIEKSSFEGKDRLAAELKDFSYYKEHDLRYGFDQVDDEFAASSSVAVGLVSMAAYLCANASGEDGSVEIEGEDLLISGGVFLGAGFLWRGLCWLYNETIGSGITDHKKVLIRPYHDSE